VVGVPDEEIAMLDAGEAPAQSMPQIFEFALARYGLPVGEISDRIIAADGKLALFAARGRDKNRDE